VIILKWYEIITILIAVYGAILSTITLVHQNNKDKRIIDVVPSWGFLTYDYGISEDAYIIIEVSNKGHVPVVVNTPYIILPNDKTIVFPNSTGDVNFPNELMPGHSCRIWTKANDVKSILRQQGFEGKVSIKAGAKDGTGEETIGSKVQNIQLN
jgi:hypothetical protein